MNHLEPNYQPEPPSNQQGNIEDCDIAYELTNKELSELYLTELLNQVSHVTNIALNPGLNVGITKIHNVYQAIDRLQVAYQTYFDHEIKSQEM